MNVHFSYKVSKTPDLEKLIKQQTEKLERYLEVFRPELVHLKGNVEENSARQGFVVSLNLRLPSGQMASQETSSTAVAAIKAAFDAITEQLKKHKELLRNQHKWARRRGARRAVIGTVPFEQTVAAVKPELISASDISAYINVNLPRLRRFVQRELDYREGQGQVPAGQIAVEDVIGEAIATALGNHGERPERMKLEPWLYRMAREAIEHIASDGGEEYRIALEQPQRRQNVQASDEPRLQFHQPDESLVVENMIPDRTANNPEELAARREMLSQVEQALGDAGGPEREAFLLYTVEGFSLEEIADITKRSVEEVRASIRKGREHLQRALPIRDAFKDKLMEYSKSA